MKIYTSSNTGDNSVEIVLNYQELKSLARVLVDFENEVKQFKNENKDKECLGFTHLHLKDCGLIDEDVDIVFYLNLDQ